MATRVVWRYDLPPGEGEFSLDLPPSAEFVSLTVAWNEPRLYFAVDPDEVGLRPVRFFARDTGAPLDPKAHHGHDGGVWLLGTFVVELRHLGGLLVRHVWMEAPHVWMEAPE